MHHATLCLLVQEGKILLGMKKRGFGAGWYNGFGGKLRENELPEQAALRELQEEVGISAELTYLEKVAELTFFFPHQPKWDQLVHVYTLNYWNGNPKESEEMAPQWFPFSQIPYQKMWPDDPLWLPLVLKREYVTATIIFGENKEILEHKIETRPLS